jgi:hypothetical protein
MLPNNLLNILQENMTNEQFFSLNEQLMNNSPQKLFDAEKIRKLINRLKKNPNISDAAILSSNCSEESFVRNLYKLEVHKPMMEIIKSTKDSEVREVLLFGLAELALDQEVVKKMVEEREVIPFFLEYLYSDSVELASYSIKALTTLLMTKESISMLLHHDKIINTVIKYIDHKSFIFRMCVETQGKGTVIENQSQVLGNTLRFVMTLGQVPIIRDKFIKLGVLEKLEKIKAPKNNFDKPMYEGALKLFKTGEMVSNEVQVKAQKAMEKRIDNPSDIVNEKKCAYCDKSGTVANQLKSCSNCKKIKYCSRECQVAHWKQHKIYCKK